MKFLNKIDGADKLITDANNRLVKDTDISNWNNKSDKGHKHTKSEITDFPTSLPANGGNADTVGGFTVGTNVPANAKFTDTVTTINGKTGAITKADIVALGIPAQDTTRTSELDNDSGFITSAQAPVQSVNSKTGAVTLSKSDVGLGSVDNKSSATIRSEITSDNVTGALGYTPVNKDGDTVNGNLGIGGRLTVQGGMTFQSYGQNIDFNAATLNNITALSTRGATPSFIMGIDYNGYPQLYKHGFTVLVKNKEGGHLQNNQTFQVVDNQDPANQELLFGVKPTGLVQALDFQNLEGAKVSYEGHNHVISNIDGLQAALDAKETPSGAQTKADSALASAKNYTDAKVAGVVNSAPEALDTLYELAEALGNDPNFATTVMTEIGTKETPDGAQAKVDAHANLTNNPHSVTKSQVGLGSVSNYGLATQAEAEAGTIHAKYMTPLRTKQAIDALQAVKSVAGKTGTVTLTKGDVGLSNVDNTSDMDKPISTAVQTALDGKVDNSRVLTDVPVNAKFTDTLTTINGKTGVITKADIVALGIPASDTNTTYAEITTAEIDAGTSSTLRTITARRLKYLLDKIVALFPTKTSELTNDSGFITSSASITGNAATATKLQTARTIRLTGDVTGSVSFDGSANASITATVADDSHNHVISNVDGLQAALDAKETLAGAQAKADIAEQNAKNYTDSELVAHAKNATLNQLGHVNHAVLTTTLNTSWSGSSAPYTKTISVSGILATDTPFIDIVMSGTYATDTARQEAWGYIYRAVTANGSITFYATDKPTVSLPLQIKVLR